MGDCIGDGSMTAKLALAWEEPKSGSCGRQARYYLLELVDTTKETAVNVMMAFRIVMCE